MTRSAAALKALAFLVATALAAGLGGCIIVPPEQPAATTAAPEAVADQGVEEQAPEPPPPLPEYEQPPCPEEGYIWTPGVWRWGPQGYFWVPGTWVAPPQPGMLWTPGYWGVAAGVYSFHRGYWGPHVGYYGGINYGAGYNGDGYHGGRWVNNRFQYNTAVNNVNVTNIHNTYHETVVNNVTVNNTTVNSSISRVSYTGAPGTRTQPTRAETVVAREPHTAPTAPQLQHHNTALATPALNAARNEGRPPIAATPRPGAFNDRGVTAAKPVGPAYHPQSRSGKEPAKEERPGEPRP